MRPGKIALLPLISILTGVLALIVVAFVLYKPQSTQNANANISQNTNLVACARDAKICPDGSTVGRAPPDCEFSACPSTNVNGDRTLITNTTNTNESTNTNAGGETYSNTELGFKIQLPAGWEVDADRTSVDEIVFTDGLESENREAVKSTLTAQTLDEWAAIFQGEDGYRVSDYTLDGHPAKRVRYAGLWTDFIGTNISGRLYVVTVGRMETYGMLDTLDLLP